MTTPSDLTTAGRVVAVQRAARVRRFQRFPLDVLARLALLPEWDDAFARDARLAGSGDLTALLTGLEAAGVTESRDALGPDGQTRHVFWLRSSMRSDLARYLRENFADGLEAEIRSLASLVQGLGDRATPDLKAWLAVATEYRFDAGGQNLGTAVDLYAQEGRFDETTRRLSAAYAVGELLPGPLVDAARRAEWRVERARRDAQDERYLLSYVRRDAMEGALDALVVRDRRPPRAGIPAPPMPRVEGPPLVDNDRWALHLLGAGGVGKTMVVRYLASGAYSRDRGVDRFPVARVDFDHLDPRYPEQRPAELLLALATELAGFSGSRTFNQAHRGLRDEADALHEEVSRASGTANAEQFLPRVIDRFARLLDACAEPRQPVVLILDTCEEIAKLYPPGTAAPGIDQTFRILELLHEKWPRLRVVLAGRRWLTTPPGDRAAAGPILQSWPFLRVVEVDGFSRDEAVIYVQVRQVRQERTNAGHRREAPIRDDLRAAILDRSREHLADKERYNPFELAGYVDWALSDPDLDPAALAADPSDPYVERRIIGRLADHEVRQSLAVAAEFARFDRTLITPALRRLGIDPQAAFNGLSAQEWTTVESVYPDGSPRVIAIDEHLRERIRDVTSTSGEWSRVDRARLGEDAAAVVDGTPPGELADLPVETIEAAVRMLPVADAGELWLRLESRITEAGAWAWAGQITSRVGAVVTDRMPPEGPSILAAVLATRATCRARAGAAEDAALIWRQVEGLTARYPDATVAEALRQRAILGGVAAGGINVAVTMRNLGRAALGFLGIYPHLTDMLVGAAMATLEGLLDRGELRGAAFVASRELLAHYRRPSVRATLALARAMFAYQEDRFDDAARLADEAIRAAESRADEHGERALTDWTPPRRLLDRCRLMRLLIMPERDEPWDSLPMAEWREAALSHLDDGDAERLVSMTVRIARRQRRLAEAPLERLEAAERAVPGSRPATWLHRQVRPLSVELAMAWVYLDRADRAVALLRDRRERAVASADDPDTLEAIDTTLSTLLAPSTLQPQPAESQPSGRSFSVSVTATPDGRIAESLRKAAVGVFSGRARGVFQGPSLLRPRTRHLEVGRSAAVDLGDRNTALHWVGTPVRTAAGWRMRIGDAYSDYRQGSGRDIREGEHLVGPFPRAGLGGELFVLQAEPVDGPPRRLGEARAGFLALAADALDAGSAVLVVPPLPDELARTAVDLIWRRVMNRRNPAAPRRLRRLHDELRSLIKAAEASDDASIKSADDPGPASIEAAQASAAPSIEAAEGSGPTSADDVLLFFDTADLRPRGDTPS